MVRPGGRREDGGYQCIEMSLLFWNGECLEGTSGGRELGSWRSGQTAEHHQQGD